MMKGYLASKGASISERDLKKHLPLLSPQWHSARHQSSSERSNPLIYTSHYFGHKLHVDQNEKLVQYGVTYVLARDGYSGKIVGQAIMAVKNNAIIYEHVYRTCTLEYGLWDEIRVDHGKEFYLLLYMHEQLRKEGRGNPDVSPYLQTSSTANHIIERIWVEVNQRVTYPIKRVIIIMDDCRLINMENSVDKYCVSVVLRRICMVGLQRMINAWNSHSVPRKGIPNVLQSQNNGTTPMDPADVPSVDNAVAAYREQGGSLTDPHEFGSDPLIDDATLLQQREDDWLGRCASTEEVYTQLMCNDSQPLQNSILHYIEITKNLSN